MAQLFKSFIPEEFLDAWIRGHYVIGPRTLDYQYAGLALILQGFYRYNVQEGQQDAGLHQPGSPIRKTLVAGYAVAFVSHNELTFAGFRLYPSTAGEPTPLFWRSPCSRFVEEDGSRKLYFPYHLFSGQSLPLSAERRQSIKSVAAAAASEGPEYLDRLEETRSAQLSTLLLELSEGRVGGPLANPQLRGVCTLSVPSDSVPTSDLTLTGDNYGLLDRTPISGAVEFRRFSKTILEELC